MSKKMVLLLIVGGFLLYATRQALKVMVGAASAAVHKLNADGVELRIKMVIINESRLVIDIQTFLGQVFYKGASLGIVQQVAPVTIQPLATGTVEMKTTIGWTTLGFNAYDIFKIYQANQTIQPTQTTQQLVEWDKFTVRGTLVAEGISIPIDTTIFV